MFDLHIIVNSISIAIKRRGNVLDPSWSFHDFAEFQRKAEHKGKEISKPCDDGYAIVNVKVNLFINMVFMQQFSWHWHWHWQQEMKEKSLKSANKHNVITIIVASSWKLSCNLMSIVLLRLLLLLIGTRRCFTTFSCSLSRRLLLRETK